MENLINFVRGGGIVERLLAFRALGHVAPGLLKQVIELARAQKFA